MGSSEPIEISENSYKKTGTVMQDFFGRIMTEVELDHEVFFREINGKKLFTNTADIITR